MNFKSPSPICTSSVNHVNRGKLVILVNTIMSNLWLVCGSRFHTQEILLESTKGASVQLPITMSNLDISVHHIKCQS